MMSDDSRRARRLVLLRNALLVIAVMASAAVAGVAGLAVYLFVMGYFGASNAQGVAALAFPLAFLVLIVAGIPAALICAVAWAGFMAANRKTGAG
jgi:hypothetical protein